MTLWIKDPKTKEASVSLSLMVISFTALLAASTLHLAKLTENTSSLTELFVTTAGLYFGRRFQTKSGNSIDSPKE
jgi:hypothetical protein